MGIFAYPFDVLFAGELHLSQQGFTVDGNKKNNVASNLEWCSRSENNVHAYKTGLMTKKLTYSDVAAIKEALEASEKRIGGVLARKYGVSVSMISLIKRGKYKYKS